MGKLSNTASYADLMIEELTNQLDEIGFFYEIEENADKSKKHISIGFFVDLEIEEKKEIPYQILVIPDEDLKIINILIPNLVHLKSDVLEYKDFADKMNLLNAATVLGSVFYINFEDEISINYSHSFFCEEKKYLSARDFKEVLMYANYIANEIYDTVIIPYKEFDVNLRLS